MKSTKRTFQPLVRIATLAVGICSVGVVLAYVYSDIQNPSPGELSGVHAQVAELASPNNCALCHGGGGVSMSASCQNCHSEIAVQLELKSGLHGQLPTEVADKCWDCHFEHQGHDFPISNLKSFEMAGVPVLAEYGHSGLDFRLSGAHLRVGCEGCHRDVRQKILPIGTKRFIGLSQDCQSCHQDVHQGSFGLDCASCHGQVHPFSQVAEFQHSDLFLIRGSHAKVECKACHVPDSVYTVAAVLDRAASGRSHVEPRQTCGECHASPHTGQFIEKVAAQANVSVKDSCQTCHSDLHPSFNDPDDSVTLNLHSLTGFPLGPPHELVDCQGCHSQARFGQGADNNFKYRYPGRHPDNCQSCHSDPHAGQFAKGTQPGTQCIDCHDRHRFLPSQFTAAQHESTAFPIHGAHLHLDCAACHQELPIDVDGEQKIVRQFHGTTTSCKQCHADPHFAQFDRGPFAGKDCNECHNDRDFARPTFTQQQHESTGFSLTGAHLAVGCRTCHRSVASDDAVKLQAHFPAVQLVAKQFQGVSTKCNACHADVHSGAFDNAAVPSEIENRTDCARCHSTDSFRGIRLKQFDHKRWTGFELVGSHRAANCTDCHQRSGRPDQHGRTFGKAAGTNCQDCHSDPHVAQFGATKDVNCAKCHSQSDRFANLTFDHQRDSAFKLDEQHSKLKCAACHKTYRLSTGDPVIRYKPLGTKCADCHLPKSPSDPRSRQ